jgi:hypothetical protein
MKPGLSLGLLVSRSNSPHASLNGVNFPFEGMPKLNSMKRNVGEETVPRSWSEPIRLDFRDGARNEWQDC